MDCNTNTQTNYDYNSEITELPDVKIKMIRPSKNALMAQTAFEGKKIMAGTFWKSVKNKNIGCRLVPAMLKTFDGNPILPRLDKFDNTTREIKRISKQDVESMKESTIIEDFRE
jgi:hypothetical protein